MYDIFHLLSGQLPTSFLFSVVFLNSLTLWTLWSIFGRHPGMTFKPGAACFIRVREPLATILGPYDLTSDSLYRRQKKKEEKNGRAWQTSCHLYCGIF